MGSTREAGLGKSHDPFVFLPFVSCFGGTLRPCPWAADGRRATQPPCTRAILQLGLRRNATGAMPVEPAVIRFTFVIFAYRKGARNFCPDSSCRRTIVTITRLIQPFCPIAPNSQVSKEGDDFPVDIEVARMSELVKGMLDGESMMRCHIKTPFATDTSNVLLLGVRLNPPP